MTWYKVEIRGMGYRYDEETKVPEAKCIVKTLRAPTHTDAVMWGQAYVHSGEAQKRFWLTDREPTIEASLITDRTPTTECVYSVKPYSSCSAARPQ